MPLKSSETGSGHKLVRQLNQLEIDHRTKRLVIVAIYQWLEAERAWYRDFVARNSRDHKFTDIAEELAVFHTLLINQLWREASTLGRYSDARPRNDQNGT